MIATDDIKTLREATGAGIMDCKKALQESSGDIDKATICLREKGYLKVQSKASRETKEGLVDSYIHQGGRLGVLIEVNCETDFVAKNEDFKQFVHDVSMHIAAADPAYIDSDVIPEEVIEAVPEEEREQFIKDSCLLDQQYIKDEAVTIGQLLTDLISKTGENIKISRFVRFKLGQGA